MPPEQAQQRTERGQPIAIENGNSGDGVSSQCKQLVDELLSQTDYEFLTAALPFTFVQSSRVEQQHNSLAYHCEKKALAAALCQPCSTADDHAREQAAVVRVRVNIRMCGDCHSAFKHASALYKRVIVCEDGRCQHRFEEGACSCGDMWR